MPNWCHNNMTITGAAEEIARFKQTCFTEGELDFNRVVPAPSGVQGSASWSDWSWGNWGTTCGPVRFMLFKDEPNCIECFFSTAWEPPMGIYTKIGELFPALQIKLEASVMENGCGYEGSIANGQAEMHEVPLMTEWKDPQTGETVTGTWDEMMRAH